MVVNWGQIYYGEMPIFGYKCGKTTLMEAEEKITLVPVGPLTNIGMALRLEPRIVDKIERRYKDEDKVAQAAKDHGYTDIYRQSLITMTEMQKLMGKKNFEVILGDLIVKPKGKPTLVPVTDKRPAIDVTNANDEFKQED